MKSSEVKLGGEYIAKVTNKLVTVRINTVHPSGGWDATNLATNRPVRIKSATRLRGPAKPSKQQVKAEAAADQENASLRDEPAASERAMAAKTPRRDKPKKREGKASCLDLAATLLGKSKEPMSCKQLVEQMLNKKLWSTNGKTPDATLYSAITREIKTKGDDARFAKVERGRFAINNK